MIQAGGKSVQNWITDFMEQFGYISVFLLITLENVFPPIPSELILTFGGFMTTNTEMTVLGVIVFSTMGSVAGAIILYWIGRVFDVKKLEKIIGRWGHLLQVKVEDIEKADNWFKRYGYWTVFICRMIPVIRSLISIPAGMSKMRFSIFLLYTTAGTLVWNTMLVCLGAFLGESWGEVLEFMDVYSNIAYTLMGAVGITFIAYWFLKKRDRN
ncbi:MAG: alkaline phosphatase [Clostridia bacterium]|jgi:membrane protein DedA with SNARE-associated domain|nr:alkaline phosphatase [Clostridia bacterium]